MTTQSCQWHDTLPCQFSKGDPLPQCSEHNGKFYCSMHLPLGAANAPNSQVIMHSIPQWGNKLCGVQFPASTYDFKEFDGEPDLSFCTFESGVELQFAFRGFSMKNSVARGELTIITPHQGSANLDGIVCNGMLKIRQRHQTRCDSWSFRNANFLGGLNISGVAFSSMLTLDGSMLGGTFKVGGSHFPQQTTAHGMRVNKSAIIAANEGAFRTARIEMSDLRNRELEGTFYSWEKRCHRVGMKLTTARSLFARCMSALYDWASLYGQSYERAAGWFLIVQLVFALGYSLASSRFELDIQPDSSVWVFTFSQLAKPFELLSARAPTSTFFADVLGRSGTPSGWWLLATSIHSVVSLSLVALFLLALRWRFRRE